MNLAGSTLAGRYQVLELLGKGGMGSVYRAHDRELDELVALKVIHSSLAAARANAERFRHEVKLARRVTHANIARTFELGRVDDMLFCTMELVDGESLRNRINRTGKLPLAEACAIIGELCNGLDAAHAAGVIHRDIKPDNILLAHDGRVVLADFGIAAIKFADENEVAGTPAYMAPEQARGESPTPAVDVYAVGLVLYEMLTGTPGFAGTTMAIRVKKQELEHLPIGTSDIPKELAFVIGQATARDHTARIASVAELQRMLAPWISTEIHVAPGSRATPSARELCPVVVLPPRADGDPAQLHIAEGTHEELLQRLVQVPGLRVLPRADARSVSGALIVELLASDVLTVIIRPVQRPPITLQLPLEIADVTLAATTAVAAITDAALHDDAAHDVTARARALLLRARSLAQRSIQGITNSFALLERAQELCPDDPEIIAALAMLSTRHAVLSPNGQALVPRAKELTRQALLVASDLAASHVAAGHLELHLGEAPRAATHFRTAIACSPWIAEGHDCLGRMLLEAGFIDLGLARIEDALAIAPSLASARWDLAKAFALRQQWDAHDQLVTQLRAENDRQITRMRFAWWRGDLTGVGNAISDFGDVSHAYDPRLFHGIQSVVLDNQWSEQRASLLEIAATTEPANRRRRSFVFQLMAETAGFCGDAITCVRMIERASEAGLFDLHWLDRCPLIEVARTTRQFAPVYAQVKRRADAILDALYGDHEASELSDTVTT